jgi:hypothetical protein
MARLRFPTPSGRRSWLIRTLGLAAATAAFAIVFAAASGANLSGSTFEGSDGNLVVNTAGNHDWDNAPNLSVGVDLPTGQTDNSFGQGTKEDNTSITVVAGSIPNSKADLARFAIAGEVIGGQTYMYLAWSRENQSGTVNFDFELNKLAQPDLTTPGPKTLNRSVNDVLINYAFAGGSNTPTLTKYHWSGSAWVNDGAIGSTCEEGQTNSTPVSENLGGNPAVIRPAQQFGEAAINLTCAGIVPQGACESFGSGYVKSRSSTSFTSEIEDFIAPVGIHFSNCGKLTIVKHTDPAGLDQDFSYSTTGGLSPGSFTLNDGSGKVDTQVYNQLQPGTYTVTEGSDPTGFAFESLSCAGAGGSSSGETATAVITGGSDITCTYVNKQQLGAIKVTKTSTKGTALAGATFSVTGPGGFSTTLTSGADGTACVDGLVFGAYHVTESSAPTGYKINDQTTHDVTVGTNTTCSGTPSVSLSFTDTPLTDLTVESKSQAVGGTKSQITCVDSSNANVGNSPSGNVEDATVSAPGLEPGTYTCTVVIDP